MKRENTIQPINPRINPKILQVIDSDQVVVGNENTFVMKRMISQNNLLNAMKTKITKYLPATLFFSFIVWIIFQADLQRDNLIIKIGHAVPYGDKMGHILLFGILALLINKALNFRGVDTGSIKFYLGSIIVFCFAISEEFTQLAFEHRNFDYKDIIADLMGIVFFSSAVFRRWLRLITLHISQRVSKIGI